VVVEVVSSRQEKVGLEGKMEGCQHLLQVGRKVVGQAEAKMVEEELRFGQPEETELAGLLLAAMGQGEGWDSPQLGATSLQTE